MATRTRSRVNLKTYPERLERFLAQYMEAVYRQLAGLDEEMGLAAIYAEHGDLFSTAAIDALRERSAKDDEAGREARELLAFAVQQHAAAAVADLTERIEVAEAQAVIIWQGEPIPYRQVPNRAADIANRIARNALYDSYLEAVEAINPLREEKLAAVREAVRGLGYADVPAMVAATAGFDPDALAAEMRLFLAESETVYFAALRRFLAEIDIEQGDASKVDLEHVIRGEGWDRWFEAHRMLPAFRATLNGLGIDIDAQPSILLDIEPRPQKSARAFCAAVNVPNDVRLVIQPRGGWDDYAAAPARGRPRRALRARRPGPAGAVAPARRQQPDRGLRPPLRAPGGRARLAAPHHRHAGRRGRRLRRLQCLLVPAPAAGAGREPALRAEPAPRRGPGHRARGVRRACWA